MKPEYITTYYEFAHGSKPRGRGAWAFEPVRGIWPNGSSAPEGGIAWATGTYTEAKNRVAATYPNVSDWVVLS
jgi:hypothetical protein